MEEDFRIFSFCSLSSRNGSLMYILIHSGLYDYGDCRVDICFETDELLTWNYRCGSEEFLRQGGQL